MEDESVILWTQQHPRVPEILRRDGIYRVKRDYVDQKYQESSWSFQTAYSFFIREMGRILPPQPGEESPIWLHGTPEGTGVFSDAPLLKLRIPRSACVFFDSRKWNRILNLDYLPASAADGAAFQAKLEQQGVTHSSMVFRVPYYPILKREILGSWSRLFDDSAVEPAFLQAAVWRLETGWCLEIR